jgi:hypothetical protein
MGCKNLEPQEYRLSYEDLVGCVRLIAEVLEADPFLVVCGLAAGERNQADKRGGRWVQPVREEAA